MTPENQRDEEIKIYYDDEYITVTEAISKLTPEEIDRGNHCDQTIIDLISAITSLRQSWEKEKAGLEERVRELEARPEEINVTFDPSATKLMINDMAKEITRLKAENEMLKNKDFVVEAVKQVEASDAMYRTQCQIIKQKNDEITRLTASLAMAHEALEPFATLTEYDVMSAPVAVGWLTNARKALSDPTGHLAFEKWKKMEALNAAFLRKFKVDGGSGRTWDAHEHLKAEKEVIALLEALDAKGGVK